MTANAFYGDRARSLAADMVNFVTEPIDPQRLFSVILNWLHEPAVLADEAQNAHTSPAAQQPNASASLQALAIGVDYALKNLGGKEVLPLRHIKRFVLFNGSALGTVKAHLQEGDRVLARRVGHPLKERRRPRRRGCASLLLTRPLNKDVALQSVYHVLL